MLKIRVAFSIAFLVFGGVLPSFVAAQPSGTAASGTSPNCEVRVWQSKIFLSDNSNAVGGLIGAMVQGVVDRSAPPTSVREQMAQNLQDQELAAVVRNLDWSRYVGARQVDVRVESSALDEKAMSALERSQTENSPGLSGCHIDLFVARQTFQGGMKTWLFSKFGVRKFDAGQYRAGQSIEYTHVQNFPGKTAESYPAAVEAIRSGFARNLTKFLDKKLSVHT